MEPLPAKYNKLAQRPARGHAKRSGAAERWGQSSSIKRLIREQGFEGRTPPDYGALVDAVWRTPAQAAELRRMIRDIRRKGGE
jgi:hypothetical protein